MATYMSGMIPKQKKKNTGTRNPLVPPRQGASVGTRNPPAVSYGGQGSPVSSKFFIDPETISSLPWNDPSSGWEGPPPGETPAPAPAPPPGPAPPPPVPDSTPSDPTMDPEWGGDFPMPPNISPEQWAFLQKYVGYQSDMLDKLQSGEPFLPEFEYPEFADFYPEDYYERAVRDPAMSRFTETTMPNLRESMGSGFWSTARQKGEQKAMTDLDQMLLAEQAKMESDRTKSRTQWEQERAKMGLQHTGMEEKARQDYMNQMLGMMGISPFDTVVPGEGQPSLIDSITGGGGIGAILKDLFGL